MMYYSSDLAKYSVPNRANNRMFLKITISYFVHIVNLTDQYDGRMQIFTRTSDSFQKTYYE